MLDHWIRNCNEVLESGGFLTDDVLMKVLLSAAASVVPLNFAPWQAPRAVVAHKERVVPACLTDYGRKTFL